MKRVKLIAFIVITTIIVCGCSTTTEHHFYIGNTSKDKKTGYIKISLDSIIVFADSVRYLKDSIIKLSDWERSFSKALTPKESYTLTVEADNNPSLKRTENIKKNERWIYIDYYHYDEGLTINVAKTTALPANK